MKDIADFCQTVTSVCAFIALILTVKVWDKARKDAIEQVKLSTIMSTNYTIYEKVLRSINEISSKNSSFISVIREHIKVIANILNKWHGQAGYNEPTIEEKIKLLDGWLEPTQKIVDEAYKLQYSILELTRILDMSGADFGDNSKIYNALWLVYHDLNNRIQKIINKWTTLDIEHTTIRQYEWLLNDTNEMIDEIGEFGYCVEDVLKHVYNKLVAEPMDKTKKAIELDERRRIITEDGLKDNRIKNAS